MSTPQFHCFKEPMTSGRAFHASASTHSSAHGEAVGAENIAALLAVDHGTAMPLQLVSTNQYVAGSDSHTVLTGLLGRAVSQT